MVTVLKGMRLDLEPRHGDHDWPVRLLRSGDGPEEQRTFGVGGHFFGRIAAEMLSPRTMVLHCTMPPDAEGQALIDAEVARLDNGGTGAVTPDRSN
jgi:hypothetical protein